MRKLSWIWLILWFAPAFFLQSYRPDFHLASGLQGPEISHPLGFDAFGRDFLVIVLKASATSSLFAIFAVVLSYVVSLAFGVFIAIAPNIVRFYGLRMLETLLAFPSILFALTWAAIRGPGWDTLLFALLIGTMPALTRLVYLRTREILSEDFILASRSLGAGHPRLISRHIVPAVFSFCSVKAPNLFAHALMAEATVSFLGIGAPLGRDTWGSLLAQGNDYLVEAPHIAIGAGVPLIFTLLALHCLSANLLSDEVFNRRAKKQ